MGENLCDTGRIPTIQEYCDFRKSGIAYDPDVKPQVSQNNGHQGLKRRRNRAKMRSTCVSVVL